MRENTTPQNRVFRYVPWPDVDDYLRMGFMFGYDLGPYHGDHRVSMEYRCCCVGDPRPKRKRCRLNKTGRNRLYGGYASKYKGSDQRAMREGTIVGESTDGSSWRIVWDGLRPSSVNNYNKSIIEILED